MTFTVFIADTPFGMWLYSWLAYQLHAYFGYEDLLQTAMRSGWHY